MIGRNSRRNRLPNLSARIENDPERVLLSYENASLAICAATYAYHLSQTHAFIDGAKRIAAAVAELFISINNARLEFTNDEIVDLFMGIAASQITRD